MATKKGIVLHPYNTSADDYVLYPKTYNLIINYKTLSGSSTTYTFDSTQDISISIDGITETELASQLVNYVTTDDLSNYLPTKSTTTSGSAYKELKWNGNSSLNMYSYNSSGVQNALFFRLLNSGYQIINNTNQTNCSIGALIRTSLSTSADTNYSYIISLRSKQVTSDTDSTLTNKNTYYYFYERNSVSANLYTLNNAVLKIDDFLNTSGEPIDVGDSTSRLVSEDEITTFNNKQDKLVSGSNIKTINNQSLLGSGNIVINDFSLYTGQNGIFGSSEYYNLDDPSGNDKYSIQLGNAGFTLDDYTREYNFVKLDDDGVQVEKTDNIRFSSDNTTLTTKLDAKQDKLSGTIGGAYTSTYDKSQNFQNIYLNNGTLTGGGFGFTRETSGRASSTSTYYKFYDPAHGLSLDFGYNSSNSLVQLSDNVNNNKIWCATTTDFYVPRWGGKGSSTQPIYFDNSGFIQVCDLKSSLANSLTYKIVNGFTNIYDLVNEIGIYVLVPYGYAWMLYRTSSTASITFYPNYGTLETFSNNSKIEHFRLQDGNEKIEIHSLTSASTYQLSACTIFKINNSIN